MKYSTRGRLPCAVQQTSLPSTVCLPEVFQWRSRMLQVHLIHSVLFQGGKTLYFLQACFVLQHDTPADSSNKVILPGSPPKHIFFYIIVLTSDGQVLIRALIMSGSKFGGIQILTVCNLKLQQPRCHIQQA